MHTLRFSFKLGYMVMQLAMYKHPIYTRHDSMGKNKNSDAEIFRKQVPQDESTKNLQRVVELQMG